MKINPKLKKKQSNLKNTKKKKNEDFAHFYTTFFFEEAMPAISFPGKTKKKSIYREAKLHIAKTSEKTTKSSSKRVKLKKNCYVPESTPDLEIWSLRHDCLTKY